MSLIRTSTARWGALVLGLAGCIGQSQAALLMQQPPTLAAEDVRVGSEGQGALLAETFSFEGVGQQLVWWGTHSTGFTVRLHAAGDPSSSLLSTTLVSAMPTASTVSVGAVDLPVFRFSVDLPGLAGGTYTVSVLETALDPLGQTWYWLVGSGGDGEHISGFGEAFEVKDLGGDLALEVIGERPVVGVPTPATLPLALSAGVIGWYAARRRLARPQSLR